MFIKALPVGVDDFEKMVTRDYYFVDKTNFIKDLLEIRGDVNLFTRPRRFGKTLNLSMIQYFFEDMRDNEGRRIDHRGLFAGLDIMRAGNRILSHMGQYPVSGSHNIQPGKEPPMVYSSALIITHILKKILDHTEIQRFAKTSGPCKQVDVSPDFQKILYEVCLIYKIVISCDHLFKIVNPHGQCFDKHGYTPCAFRKSVCRMLPNLFPNLSYDTDSINHIPPNVKYEIVKVP